MSLVYRRISRNLLKSKRKARIRGRLRVIEDKISANSILLAHLHWEDSLIDDLEAENCRLGLEKQDLRRDLERLTCTD